MKKMVASLVASLMVMTSVTGVMADGATVQDTIPLYTTGGYYEGYLIDSKTYVPIGVFRELELSGGGNVGVVWESSTKEATVTMNIGDDITDVEVKTVINQGNRSMAITITKDGEISNTEKVDNVDIVNLDDRIYLPRGVFSDYLGLEVIWDSEERTVDITGELNGVFFDVEEVGEETTDDQDIGGIDSDFMTEYIEYIVQQKNSMSSMITDKESAQKGVDFIGSAVEYDLSDKSNYQQVVESVKEAIENKDKIIADIKAEGYEEKDIASMEELLSRLEKAVEGDSDIGEVLVEFVIDTIKEETGFEVEHKDYSDTDFESYMSDFFSVE